MSTNTINESSLREALRSRSDAVTDWLGRLSSTYLILGVGAFLRVTSFLISNNNGTDALARASLTADLLANPRLRLAFGDWPPVHFWLMAGAAVVVGDVELAARMLSLVMGLASLWLFWKAAQELCTNVAANLSLAVFVFYSLHISSSVTSSSEAPYLFFLLAGFLSFLIYRRSGQLGWIALSGLSLTVAAGIRYEAWVVIFGVAVILIGTVWNSGHHEFWRSIHLKGLLVFGVTGASWPIFWMAYCWSKWNHPLYFVAMNHLNVARTMAAHPTSAIYRASVFPASLLITLSPVAFLAGLYAVWLAFRESNRREIAIIVLTLAVVESYQVFSGGVMAFARYTITIGTLLALVSGYGLERIAQQYFPRNLPGFRTTVVAILALNLGTILALGQFHWKYSEKFGAVSPRVRYPFYIDELASNLRARLGTNDSIVIDDYNVQSNIVAAAVGLPLLTGDRAFLASTVQPSKLRGDLQAYMSSHHPRFIVYSDQGALRPYLGLPAGCPSSVVGSEEAKFKCLFTNDVYKLYEVTYP